VLLAASSRESTSDSSNQELNNGVAHPPESKAHFLMETSGLGQVHDGETDESRAEWETGHELLSPADLHHRLLASYRDELHFSFMWRVASVSVPMLLATSIWVVLNP
jgi:hypothetical protein